MSKEFSPTRKSAAKTLLTAFIILREAGAQLPGREVIEKIPKKIDLTEWEKEKYEKTGYIRWESILHFYTIGATKAGLLRKYKGLWILTPEGEESIKLGGHGLIEKIDSAYKKWDQENKNIEDINRNPATNDKFQKATLEQLENKALEGLRDYIIQKNPYEFQDLVAALIRAMGYYTPFISPKGKDGGIDIIAYQDPIGANEPRIKIQVKHKPDTIIPVDDIRSLMGVLNKDGDVGMLVTSGRFTAEGVRQARDSKMHVELIDFEKFISLWQDFYTKMPDEDKNLLPLYAIYFLGTNE